MEDPSEAVRSSAILPAVHRLFSIIEERSYGGQLVALLLPQIARENLPASELDRLISSWLEIEDQELKRNPAAGFYTALIAKPRRGLGSFTGQAANFCVRILLAVRYRVLPVLYRRRNTLPDMGTIGLGSSHESTALDRRH